MNEWRRKTCLYHQYKKKTVEKRGKKKKKQTGRDVNKNFVFSSSSAASRRHRDEKQILIAQRKNLWRFSASVSLTSPDDNSPCNFSFSFVSSRLVCVWLSEKRSEKIGNERRSQQTNVCSSWKEPWDTSQTDNANTPRNFCFIILIRVVLKIVRSFEYTAREHVIAVASLCLISYRPGFPPYQSFPLGCESHSKRDTKSICQ